MGASACSALLATLAMFGATSVGIAWNGIRAILSLTINNVENSMREPEIAAGE